ncbi:adenosine deaminase-like [Arctopsyche grandis]|uniref:adenosine deaminase-like n=1 Tax=Arctopsyche grandis TaxID=121162 RepID=UPI00406D8529
MVVAGCCQSALIALTTLVAISNAAVTVDNGILRTRFRANEDHYQERARIIAEERTLTLGGSQTLTPAESLLNERLMMHKHQEVDKGFEDVSTFNPAQHFFKRKAYIDASPVFKFLRRMPKGAVLHVHDASLIGVDFLVKNITYMDNLYICVTSEELKLHFFKTQPRPTKDCVWQLLKNVRDSSQDPEEFDYQLSKHFTLEVKNPAVAYPNIDVVWAKFSQIFLTVTPMLTYKPAWEAYFYEALTQFRADNVMYMEIRTTLPDLYDLEGNVYGPEECARTYKKINDQFKEDYPDSFGARIIYAPMRLVTPEQVRAYVKTAVAIRNELGDFFAGFDLVGQEDKGRPLEAFLPELVTLPSEMNVFYHSGETNWYGLSSDYNLIDAVLLGAKRLGHAYALLKHPVVANMVKENDIAVEVNPLSNQILMLVADVRNHPASLMLANNYPLVISSDDPGIWGSLPMSHDMYMAFVGLASREDDLKLLKQLVVNSIKYSSMPSKEKYFAMSKLTEQWDLFIQSELANTTSSKKN